MTPFKRGDVVLVKFPYSDLVRYKKRPALVVQDETVETGLSQRVVVQITSNLERTGETRVRVSKDSPAGQAMGILSDSVIVAGLIKRHKKAAIGTVAVLVVLAGLAWFVMRRSPKPSAELTQKRLTFNSSENPVESSAISPDGKYLAYSDPAGIHVKLLSSGDERLIPRPAGVPVGANWGVASWFPDSTQLLAGR